MSFFGLSNESVRSAISDASRDEYEGEEVVLKYLNNIYFHPSEKPLFSGCNAYTQNIQALLIFIKRIDDSSFYDDLEALKFSNYSLPTDFYSILTGRFVACVFKNGIIEINHKEFNFHSADEMYYCLGAHFSNILNFKDPRVVTSGPFQLADGKKILNSYVVNIHGDFRISQYDVSFCEMTNPLDDTETLPFSIPKHFSSIAGYHSVEAGFLAILIHYAQSIGVFKDIVEKKDFLSGIDVKEQKLGNFGDAGLFMSGMSRMYFMSDSLPKIYIEHGGFYEPVISDGVLGFNTVIKEETNSIGFKIYPEMVESLIEGLFLKVLNGNGRSSVIELAECLESGIKHYLEESEELEGSEE